MMFYNNFVINPDKFRIPQYTISPFSTEWIKTNYRLLESTQKADGELLHRYFDTHLFFESGKSALLNALLKYNLDRDDEVYIVTSSGNRYISSCVTSQIEKFCKWSRAFSKNTRLVLINHEFGVVYNQIEEILKLGLPIIEDMAMSMFSSDNFGKTGSYGDFTIYSLPKFFPVQFGGLLRINNLERFPVNSFRVEPAISDSLGRLLSFYSKDVDEIKERRINNHKIFEHFLSPSGFRSRFSYLKNETPSVYMCVPPGHVDLDGLKVFLQQNGIESSIFYGEEAFFVPIHQYLNEEDILFISTLIRYYCLETNSTNQ